MKPIFLETIDQSAMCEQALAWSAVNTGTGNLDGLQAMAGMLADAFAVLPGEISLRDPAPVTAISADGEKFDKQHGRHLVLRVRPQAERRVVLTGHMDTVFPADHPFQSNSWLGDDVVNGPGTADMKGGIAVMLHALIALERSENGRDRFSCTLERQLTEDLPDDRQAGMAMFFENWLPYALALVRASRPHLGPEPLLFDAAEWDRPCGDGWCPLQVIYDLPGGYVSLTTTIDIATIAGDLPQ